MEYFIIPAATLLALLSFANGANDVSKAIATLAGARVTSMRKAVLWGTIWTLAGSLSGLYLGAAIIKNITQNVYLIPPDFSFAMASAIGLAPALWVGLATWRKWPVSTTHAVVGGLLGAGVTALGAHGIAWSATLQNIALPLLVSPFLAIGFAYLFSPALENAAAKLQRVRVCVSPMPKFVLIRAGNDGGTAALQDCVVCDQDSMEAAIAPNFGLSVDHMHWLTSGVLSFSRGLNDTPKLIAVILPFLIAGNVAQESLHWMFMISAFAMAAGGLLVGSRITEILGFRVTALDHSQGFCANVVAAILVLFASKLGLPVSTTHVSACSIMGVGISGGRGIDKRTVSSMLFAWLVTVPAAALFATLIYKGALVL